MTFELSTLICDRVASRWQGKFSCLTDLKGHERLTICSSRELSLPRHATKNLTRDRTLMHWKIQKEQLQYLSYCSKFLFGYTPFKKLENFGHFAQSVLTCHRIFFWFPKRKVKLWQVCGATRKNSDIVQNQSLILHEILRPLMVL